MKRNTHYRISLSFVVAFVLTAVLFYPSISCSDGEARFVLHHIASYGSPPVFQSGSYAFPFEEVVVSEGRYCGLEISFVKKISKQEQLILLFDLPCTNNLSVWEKWNAEKRERTLESHIKQLPLTLTELDLTTPNEDAPPTATKRTWSPKFYLERKISDSNGSVRSQWINFDDLTLTIKSFLVQGKQMRMQVDFKGRVTLDRVDLARVAYTKGIYEIEGSFDVTSDKEIGLRMTD